MTQNPEPDCRNIGTPGSSNPCSHDPDAQCSGPVCKIAHPVHGPAIAIVCQHHSKKFLHGHQEP